MRSSELAERIAEVRGSLHRLAAGGGYLKAIESLLSQIADELASPAQGRGGRAFGDQPDSVDLITRTPELLSAAALDRAVFAACPGRTADDFELEHLRRIGRLPALLHHYFAGLLAELPPGGLARFKLGAPEEGHLASLASVEELAELAAAADPLRGGRTLHGDLSPVELTGLRRAKEFYGFEHVRSVFNEHFAAFASGTPVPPLFVVSLPGLGKTALTVAYTLQHENLTLILPDPAQLEDGLRPLLDRLAAAKNHRFVVFFDDIDPREVQWYHFRTNIGGIFAAPPNVACVIAANFEFPVNVLSRGRGVAFPIFDEISCQEMIHDFLTQHFLRNPDKNLVSVMAADYVEEFGQKKFTELSPRTLVRYLESYVRDPKKRKKMLDASRQEMIVRPDAQLFYEQNIKMMRALYGDGCIEELLREKLRKLGGEA